LLLLAALFPASQKRLLNTGDEIALVSATSLSKIRSHDEKEVRMDMKYDSAY
jgi:hypothetical protein